MLCGHNNVSDINSGILQCDGSAIFGSHFRPPFVYFTQFGLNLIYKPQCFINFYASFIAMSKYVSYEQFFDGNFSLFCV